MAGAAARPGYIAFLHGADGAAVRETFEQSLLAPFRRKYGDEGVERVDGATLESAGLLQASAETVGMFTTKRLLVVRGLFSNRAPSVRTAVANLLPRLLELPVVVAFLEERELDKKTEKTQKLFKQLSSLGSLVREFVAPTPGAVATRLTAALKAQGVAINPDAAALLGQDLASDPTRIPHELEKLLLYKHGDATPLTADEVTRLITPDHTSNVFALIDAIGSRQRRAVVGEFRRLVLAGEGGPRLLGMVVNHVRALLLARDLLDRSAPASDVEAELTHEPLRLHPFVAQKTTRQAQRLESADLRRLFTRLKDLDLAVKTGRAAGDGPLLDVLIESSG